MADTLKELSEKYRQMKKSRQESNTINIDDFMPTLNEMIKEDCVIDVLQDTAESLNDKDEAMDAAYYTQDPFSENNGYYPSQGIFVINPGDPASNNSTWAYNKFDGDTVDFYISNMDTGGKFTIGEGKNAVTYDDYEDYVVKKCMASSNSYERSKISVRFAGYNAAEIPHYEAVLIYNQDNIKKMTIKELKDLKAKGENVQFLTYDINKNKQLTDPDKWTITERSDDKEIDVYVREDDGKKNYYEIDNRKDATEYLKLDALKDHKDYIPKVIVFSNASTKDTIKDGYKAQFRLKELITGGSVSEWKLVLDANSQSYTKTYPTYTVYQTLYKAPENIKNLIQTWIDDCQGLGVPYSRLNYRAFGTDSYGRDIGTLYAKIKTDAGEQWIDVSKYIITGCDNFELTDTDDLGNGFKEATDISSYNHDSFTYVDSDNKDGIASYNEKIELHKKITGIDFKKAKEYTVMIGDFLALIPPQSIRSLNSVDYERLPIMRGKGTMTKNSANREQLLEMDLYFYGQAGINGIPYEEKLPNGKTKKYYMNGLRALLAQFRLTPFLPIENAYINDVLGIEAVALVNFTTSTVDDFPRLLKATLTLRDFNYRVYMPDLPIYYYSNEDNLKELGQSQVEQIFGKCFEWKLFRYYYQRALEHGEELALLNFNTFEYGNQFYSYRNQLQPNDLTDNYMEFYIPDEEWLKSALQYKKATDYTGQTVIDLSLSDEDEQFLKDVASLKGNIISDSKYGLNDLDISLSSTDSYIYKSAKDHTYNATITKDNVPEYSGKIVHIQNNNEPEFTDEQKKDKKSWEKYSNLDSKGRCGVAFANIGKDLMPTGERGDIDSVTPSGWDDDAKYDFIEGKKLYNRCHLIGYQLTGENANKKNLITGTKALNNSGMLPYENLVAGYIKNTGNHVLYRVTPIFKGDNLVASGVQMEAYSIEDNGEGIKFNIYVYNVQNGVKIDYATGKSKEDSNEDYSDVKNSSSNKTLSTYTFEDVIKHSSTEVKIRKGGLHNYKKGFDIIKRCIHAEIANKISANPVVSSIRIDESYLGDGKLQWILNIKLNTENCTDMTMIRENIKQLTGASSSKKCLPDDSVILYINSEWNDGDYIPSSVSFEYGNELDKIIGAYGDGTSDGSTITDNQNMFDYTKYKDPRYMKFVPFMYDEYGNSKKLDVDSITFSMSNTFTEMRLKACDGYAPQFMGGSDVVVEAKFTLTEQNVIHDLNKLPMVVTQYTKIYRKIMPCYPLKVKNSYLQTFGLNEMLIDSIQIETVDGFPGVYEVHIRMTSVDRTLRQRESLVKLQSRQVTETIEQSSIANMFDLQDQLAKAELYPDLDLPTLDDLSKCGWKYLKYKGENRVFVDPDFYIVYSFKYSAQLTKEMLNKFVYKKFLTDDNLDNLKDSGYKFEDSMGIEMISRFDEVLGSSWENSNDYADLYDDIIEQISGEAKNEGTTEKKKTKPYRDMEEICNIGTSLEYLIASGLTDGWKLNNGVSAILADPTTNKNVGKLSCSGLDLEADEDEKDNKIYKDIYDMRSKAIYLIDKILEKPITNHKFSIEDKITGNDKDIMQNCKRALVDIFVNDSDGKELYKLLNGGKEPEVFRRSPFISNEDKYFKDLFNDPVASRNVYSKSYWENINKSQEPDLMRYLLCYLYATTTAYSSKKVKNGYIPESYQYDNAGNPKVTIKISDKDKERLLLYDNDKNGINGNWDILLKKVYDAKGGGSFGVCNISTFSTEDLVKKLKPDVGIKYKYNNKDMTKMYTKETDDKVFCQDNAFIDPYYNKAGHRSEIGKEFKENIIRYPKCNVEAQLRIVLFYLKRMIIEGYFFTELDSMQDDYESIAKSIEETLDNLYEEYLESRTINDKTLGEMMDEEYSNSIGSKDEFKEESKKEQAIQTILSTFDINMDSVKGILENLPNTYNNMYCGRMIYPFIASIVGYDDDIMKYIRNRDYDMLNSLTTGLTGNGKSNDMFNKFLDTLAGMYIISGEDDNEGSKDNTSISQKVNNLIMQEAFTACSNDPRSYVLHSFYDMLTTDKRGRLLRAFPTYYIVFIDEGRKIGSWKLFDNFYNMSAISEIQIVKSRKIPADTCTFTMSNLYMSYADTYDNTIYQQYVDIYGVKDIFDSIFNPMTLLKKEDMIRRRKQLKDTTVISPGVRIHVRIGYGANAAKIPTAFNGKIAEVDCGEVVSVVCQGDGHELCNPLNALGEITAKSFQTSQHYITWFKDIRGSFMRGGESPRNLVAKLLNAEYNGFQKVIRDVTQNMYFADNPFGIYHFGNRRFQDIFIDGETVQNLYEVCDENLLMEYNTLINDKSVNASTPIINCSLQDKTFWEILNLCANSGDGYYAAIRDFGFRSTVCLCKANQYYAFEYRKNNNLVYEKRKPFQQFHYFDSYNDIVYNTIKASEKNMKTNAVGTWQSTDYIWGTSQDTVGPIFLDANIYPEYQKSMTVDTGLIGGGNGGLNLGLTTHLAENWEKSEKSDKVNKSLAEKVTTNVLRNSIKDMYEGELCIMGDPSIKPFDSMCFNDIYEDMNGTVEVETVIHSLNATTGYTTTIVPDIVTCTESIEQRAGATQIYGKFITAAGVGLSRKAASTLISSLPSYLTDVGGVVGGKLLDTAKQKIGSIVAECLGAAGKKVVLEDTGLVLTDLATGAAALNPVSIVATAVIAASTFIFCQNVKDMIYRTLKNMQAITVFPIQKNGRPLIANMAGHKGSVYGYPYPNGSEKDSIQWMIMSFYEDTPLLKGIVKTIASDYDFEGIFENWKANLQVGEDNAELFNENFSSEKNKTIFINNVYNSISQEYSARASYLQSLRTKPRIKRFDTSNKTSEEFLRYQIGGIYDDPNKDEYKGLSAEEKRYIPKTSMKTNKRLGALSLVEEDEEIQLALTEGKHSNISKFSVFHEKDPDGTIELYRESGNRRVPYLISDVGDGKDHHIYDFPMVHEDAMAIIRLIINDSNLKDHEVVFESGVRVNDLNSWKCTGFSFTISSDSGLALKKAIETVKKNTTWYSSEKRYNTFDYAFSTDRAAITVYAPNKE